MPSAEPINILVAEQNEIIRKGIETMLKELPGIKIKTYCARTATEAVQAAPYFKAHAVLMNYALPDMPACEYIKQIKERVPHAPLIILMDKKYPRTVNELMRYGCTGFVTTTATAAQLYEAITTTLNGQLYFTPDVAQEVAVHAVKKLKKVNALLRNDLTAKEKEILKDICDGLTNPEIGEKHFKSAKTIEKRLTNIYRKTKTENRQQLIVYILRKGLIVDPEI